MLKRLVSARPYCLAMYRCQSTQSFPPRVPSQRGDSGGGTNTRRNARRPDRGVFVRQPKRPMPTDLLATPGKRPNTMILLPGDFGDQRIDRDPLTEDVNNYINPELERAREEYKRDKAIREEQQKRWMKNAEPKQWMVEIDERGRSFGRGGRKRAQASVWIQAGLGELVINQQPFTEYFHREHDREICLEPFVITDTCGQFDVQCSVKGGGLSGQAGAIRLGVARALNAYDPDRYRPAMKFKGMLTRDSRKVERKKIGKVKARKSPQWVRR